MCYGVCGALLTPRQAKSTVARSPHVRRHPRALCVAVAARGSKGLPQQDPALRPALQPGADTVAASTCPRCGLPAASWVTLRPRPVPQRPLAGRPPGSPTSHGRFLRGSLESRCRTRVRTGSGEASLRPTGWPLPFVVPTRAVGLSLQDTRAPGPASSSDTKQLRARGRCPRSKAHIPSSFCQLWVTSVFPKRLSVPPYFVHRSPLSPDKSGPAIIGTGNPF